MTGMTDPSGDVARRSRRERRLINFVAPQLQANEQVELVLSLARRKKMKYPMLLLGPTFAVVITNQRVFEIRLRRLTARPTMAFATHTRESVTAEWTRDALDVGIPFSTGGGGAEWWAGKLSLVSPLGTRQFWVEGETRKDRAQAIAARLNTGRL
jgi:hypothetical protein